MVLKINSLNGTFIIPEAVENIDPVLGII